MRILAMIILTGALAGSPLYASAAQCVDGRPTVTTDSPPDCSCYAGSSPGTRVFGFVAKVIVTTDTAHLFAGDATLTCDDKNIFIRTYANTRRAAFPIVRML